MKNSRLASVALLSLLFVISTSVFAWGDDGSGRFGDGSSVYTTTALQEVLPAPDNFYDVPFVYWAYDYIYLLHSSGITSGCGDGNYCPENPVTRAQMAVFILKALGQGPAASCAGAFNDADASTVGDDFCRYIEQLANLGITSGCGGGNYCPDDPVTRAQMAVFITKALNQAAASLCAGNMFGDVSAAMSGGESFCKYIEKFATLGITSGCGEGNYCPDDPVTRAQMAVFLIKAFDWADPHLVLSVNSLPVAALDVQYSYSVSMNAIGGTGPYNYSCSANIPGMSAVPDAATKTCIISGTPITLDSYVVSFAVTDNDGKMDQKEAYIVVKDPPALALVPSGLSPAFAGIFYDQAVDMLGAGGSGSYLRDCTLSVSGMSASISGSACRITGTPSTPGIYPVTFSLYDSNNTSNVVSQTVDLTVNESPPVALALGINPLSVPSGMTNAVYSQSVAMTASGGVPPYVYDCSGSGVPGLTASVSGASCVISGTPLFPGTYTAYLTVTDSSSSYQQKQATFTVYDPVDIGADFKTVYPNVKTDTIPAYGTKYYYFVLNQDVVNLQFYVVNADWATDQDFMMSRTTQPTQADYIGVRNSGSNSVSPSATYWYNFNTSQLEKLTVANINARKGDRFYVTVFNVSNRTGRYQLYWAIAN